MKKSEGIATPSKNDVLFGRGGASNNNNGNKRYQRIVEERSLDYAQAKKRNEKTNIAWDIVFQLKREGSRFLRKDPKSGLWNEACDEESRAKVSQRLRERALESKHQHPKAVPAVFKFPSRPTAYDKAQPEKIVSHAIQQVETKPAAEETVHPAFLQEMLGGDLFDSGSLSNDDMSLLSFDEHESDAAVCGGSLLNDMSDSSLESFLDGAGHQNIIEWAISLPTPSAISSKDSFSEKVDQIIEPRVAKKRKFEAFE